MAVRVLKERYELTREVGAGAMGTVYDAWDRELERRVAIKLLPSGNHGADAKARFLREARLLARIHHPNVVGIFDVGSTDTGDPYIVMELLFGESLRDRLQKRTKIEPTAAALHARDIARGLAAVHSAELVHRDIKPANVFATDVAGVEVVKVLDLGVARATDEETLSKPGAVVGTVLYIAPEQIRGGDVDARADLYALGVSLYEMLQGRAPFFGPTTVETIHAHLYDPIPELGSHVPRSLARIVKKCLAKKPADRYASARALEADLEQAIAEGNTKPTAQVVLPPLLDDAPVPSAGPPLSDTVLGDPTRPNTKPAFDAPVGDLELELPPPPAPQSESGPKAPAAPLELQIESELFARSGPKPAMLAPLNELEAAQLEIERELAPAGTGLVQPPLPPRHLQRTEEPSALVGVFAVLPAHTHARVAVGAAVAGVALLLFTKSLVVGGFCAAVMVFGIIGYYVRRRHDGED